MMNNLSKVFTLLVTGLMILAIPIGFNAGAEEVSDGTDGTKMDAEAGGSGDFDWNDIHAFAISENDEKINDMFNVTICYSQPKDKGNGMEPSGNIFDELFNITWDDDPAPTITISSEDFESWKQDDNNLTVYAFGKYYDGDHPDETNRWAYRTVTITKPNNPPTPIARVAVDDGNWTWINLTVESDVTFVVEEGDDITLWFNASLSWDEDNEDVTGWAWELDEDGKFGGAGEKLEQVSRVFSVGKTYADLGLKVFDERGKESAGSVDFTIHIEAPERLPDLAVGLIDYKNYNTNKDNFEVKDVIILQPKINNIGENDTQNGFSVLIEYSQDTGATYHELTTLEITESIPSNNFELLTYNWNTDGFTEGKYFIKVTADIYGEVEEDREDNNENTTNLISLENREGEGTPELSFEFITPEKTSAEVNEPVNVTVSVQNTGDGDANYVDIKFDINGEYITFKNIELIAAGTNESVTFPFSGDAKSDYILGFILEDGQIQIGLKQTVTITVTKDDDGPYIPPDNNTGSSDDGGFIPGFELVILVCAVFVGSMLYSGRRRR